MGGRSPCRPEVSCGCCGGSAVGSMAAQRGLIPGRGTLAPQRCSHVRSLPCSPLLPHHGFKCQAAATQPEIAAVEQYDDEQASTSGRVSQYVRQEKQTYAAPPITSTGSLRPDPMWFPAWMKYRRREDNYVFWQDKFSRNSMDIAYEERRWTAFSTIWFLAMQTRFRAIPPAIRYLFYLGWRSFMTAAYEAHKKIIIWQCKLEADLAAKAVGAVPPHPSPNQAAEPQEPMPAQASDSPAAATTASPAQGAEAAGAAAAAAGVSVAAAVGPGFSRTMALRRLHWRNTMLAEVLYLINVYKTGRVHMLPPVKRPLQRPTFFWLF